MLTSPKPQRNTTDTLLDLIRFAGTTSSACRLPLSESWDNIWPQICYCIRIIANLRPKIEIFIRTLERPPRGLSGVL